MHTRVAVIAGGTRGIGAAAAQNLMELDHKVFVCGSSYQSVKQYNDEHEVNSTRTYAEVVDVTDSPALTEWIDRVASDNGKLDVLVFAAGQSYSGNALDLEVSNWDECMNLNLRAPFIAAKAALPHLVKSNGPAIVIISSIWAVTAAANRLPSITAKCGLTGLVRALAVDHAKQGIRVNAVAPGSVDTQLMRNSLAESNPSVPMERLLEDTRAAYPFGRLIDVEDIGESVAFLATDRSKNITGQTLIVDGGITTRLSLRSD
jgi:NAD(P)-dependent dehydrogenase (short-subunit alcohol dehydrogenase family)